MSTDMSFLSLIANASFIVKLVMLFLLVSSIFSWMVIFQRANFLNRSKAAAKKFEDTFWSGTDLNKFYTKLCANEHKLFGLDAIFVAGFKEFSRLSKNQFAKSDMIMETISRTMRVSLANEETKLENNLSFLATIQSMSPYIGLFGTVWGIMQSFRQLGVVQQATLSAVAPGISEALIATAMGLIAAIPAGIAYNRYVNRVDDLSLKYRMFIEEFLSIVQRRLIGTVPSAGYSDV